MYRIGKSTDIHRLVKGKKLIIGGVSIPFELGLDGHSDADVLIHAITEAILGALGLNDLGFHFSDKDPKNKDRNSLEFLEEVYKIMVNNNYEIANVD